MDFVNPGTVLDLIAIIPSYSFAFSSVTTLFTMVVSQLPLSKLGVGTQTKAMSVDNTSLIDV